MLNQPRREVPVTASWRVDEEPLRVGRGTDETTVPASADELALGPGSRLGRFRVVERVGEGGMGVVFAAYDPDLDRHVALKVLRTAPEDGEPAAAGRERLLREARALARLAHPNVIAVHEVGTAPDFVFLAMELADGGTLRQWCNAEPRPWREVLARFLAAGRGLAAAHDAGFVHRDFKPSNVLLIGDDGVRVCDFGLVSSGASGPPEGALSPPEPGDRPAADPLTVAGAIVGTPGYMAPEQMLGLAVGPGADQFAFCVAVWEALYGERPFTGPCDKLAEAVAAGPAPPPETGVPGWVRADLARGLCLDAAARWPSMHHLLAALERGPTDGLAAPAPCARRATLLRPRAACCRAARPRLARARRPGVAHSSAHHR